jgi:uncharacterized membrane protein AbrB (regulator of aidB expression)
MCTWAQWVQVKFTTLGTIVALEVQDSILFVELNFSFQNLTNYSNIIVILICYIMAYILRLQNFFFHDENEDYNAKNLKIKTQLC